VLEPELLVAGNKLCFLLLCCSALISRCDREDRHRGLCNHRATIPGPTACSASGSEACSTQQGERKQLDWVAAGAVTCLGILCMQVVASMLHNAVQLMDVCNALMKSFERHAA
jgi:hypothetical protein